MYNDIHGDFILSPLFDILKGGVNASYSLTAGIETYPLSEYFFQSLFLRMTGAQEQKLKCILWELASNDYQFRYDFLHTKSYGECSEYKAKSDVFNDLVNAIKRVQTQHLQLTAFGMMFHWHQRWRLRKEHVGKLM